MRYAFFKITIILFTTLPLAATQVDVATNNGSFVDYNTATGSYTLLGTSSAVLYGLGYTSGGVLYANDSSSAPNTGFYRVNSANGSLTLVSDLQALRSTASARSPLPQMVERFTTWTIPITCSLLIQRTAQPHWLATWDFP